MLRLVPSCLHTTHGKGARDNGKGKRSFPLAFSLPISPCVPTSPRAVHSMKLFEDDWGPIRRMIFQDWLCFFLLALAPRFLPPLSKKKRDAWQAPNATAAKETGKWQVLRNYSVISASASFVLVIQTMILIFHRWNRGQSGWNDVWQQSWYVH